MKTKYIYAVFIMLFSAFSLFILTRAKKQPEFSFVERTGTLDASGEWLNAKAAIQTLLVEIKKHPGNIKAKLSLALAYINESRASGNHAYYDGAAMALLDEVLKKDENNFEALCAKATLLLSQHHFSEGLKAGEKLVELNSYSAYAYGVMTDAYVELGNYNEAIKMADKMVSLRPDIRSYSRISYLREIFGDNQGAIEAMKMAVTAGIPGAEQTEWSRINLGKLYENTGKLKDAETTYRKALFYRPQYAYAYAGLGRIEKMKLNYKEAENYFLNAKASMKDFSFSEELSDLYRYTKQHDKSSVELKECLDELGANVQDESESFHGHYADSELAMVYLKAYNYTLALKHALTEYNRRPNNIDINRTLAWVYYRRGNFEKADKHINKAMQTNSKNPELLYEAGLIKSSAG
ncbi:MAG TPA: tetratricopeptide repeat protein, partial [Bacteroidia bacterium]|nr:tetratricopeptide repeat protein [Bacteroidia bacterium]